MGFMVSIIVAIAALLGSCKQSGGGSTPRGLPSDPKKTTASNAADQNKQAQTQEDACGLFLQSSTMPAPQNPNQLKITKVKLIEEISEKNKELSATLNHDYFADRIEWSACSIENGTCRSGQSSFTQFPMHNLPQGTLRFSFSACVREDRTGANGLRCGHPVHKIHFTKSKTSPNPAKARLASNIYNRLFWIDVRSKELLSQITQSPKVQRTPEINNLAQSLAHNRAMGVDRQFAYLLSGEYQKLKDNLNELMANKTTFSLASTNPDCLSDFSSVESTQRQFTPANDFSEDLAAEENQSTTPSTTEPPAETTSVVDTNSLDNRSRTTILKVVYTLKNKQTANVSLQMSGGFLSATATLEGGGEDPAEYFDVFKREDKEETEPFVGDWKRVQIETKGVEKVRIHQEGSEYIVQMRGPCGVQNCNWGTQNALVEEKLTSDVKLEEEVRRTSSYQTQDYSQYGKITGDMNLFFSLLGAAVVFTGAYNGWKAHQLGLAEADYVERLNALSEKAKTPEGITRSQVVELKNKYVEFKDNPNLSKTLQRRISNVIDDSSFDKNGKMNESARKSLISPSEYSRPSAVSRYGRAGAMAFAGAMMIALSNMAYKGEFALQGYNANPLKDKVKDFLKFLSAEQSLLEADISSYSSI